MDQHGIRKVAVTNAPGLNAVAMLKGLGLENAFEAVILGEECARGKPYPGTACSLHAAAHSIPMSVEYKIGTHADQLQLIGADLFQEAESFLIT